MSEINHALKVFSQLYVGLQAQQGAVDLGFATPYEATAAGRKRQETVNKWSVGYSGSKSVRSRLIDNIPREGFKITDDVKRVYWGGGNVVFRVHDPAGFELEIQSHNLMNLIMTAGIEKGGNIPGKCVWARDGAINILLHESSEEYKNALLAAEKIKPAKHLPKSALDEGLEYRLQDGSTGFYLGKYWVTCASKSYVHDYQSTVFTMMKTHVPVNIQEFKILEPEIYDAVYKNDMLFFYKKAPFIEQTGKKITKKLDSILRTATRLFASSSKNNSVDIAFVSKEKPVKPHFDAVPLSQDEFNKLKKISLREYTDKISARNIFSFDHNKCSTIVIESENSFVGYGHSLKTKESQRSYSYTYVDCLGEVKLTDDKTTMIISNVTSDENSNYYWRSPMKTVVDVKPYRVPEFNSVEEVHAWLGKLHEENKLKQVMVVDSQVQD
jgi:hypothetical protein